MKLKMRMDMDLLAEEQLERVFHDALRVWREVPFRIQGTDELFDLLTDYGCTVDGELVRFPQAVVDKVLAEIAALKQRNAAAQADAEEWPASELGMYTHGQALHICDLETNELRPATVADLADWCRAVDSFGDLAREHPTFIPTDVERSAADFHAFATIILNSRRPHVVSVYSARMLPFFIEACKTVKGSLDSVKRDPVFVTKCWVNSPFMITRENIEVAMDARRLLGVPMEFGHMPVAGAATPVTLAGALVQNTAESLALSALRFAVEGLPQNIEGTSAVLDMKDACQRQTGPDLLLHRVASAQMQAHVFGLKPVWPMLMSVSAATVSAQSVYEKALAAALSISAGYRRLGVGCLSASDVGSPVQLVLDYEMGLFFRHMLREVTVDEERIGLDTILATAPRGAYFMAEEHTARFFREESWLPRFVDNRVPLMWMNDPSNLIERARSSARELFAAAENQCPLSAQQQRHIRTLMAEAAAVAAAAAPG